MSIAIESAELMEHFQWRSEEEIREYLKSDERQKVQEEIADIASYLLLLCTDLDIDLNEAILQKVKKNALKYPVDKSRGRHDKYDRL
jgi:dCTP diphosphatase